MQPRDIKKYKPILKPVASDPTYWAWYLDGKYIITTMHVPRLYDSIGYKVWHYASCIPATIFVQTISMKTIAYQMVPSTHWETSICNDSQV